jgi:eukaryotic translation initiation factor 4E transporter
MQNALIRKKLEEQRENFRKRQEQELKEQMQKQESERKGQDETSPAQSPEEINPFDSPIKKAPAQHQLQRQHAPSPNIFTPTSVLRKMTAEKDSDGKMGSDKKKAITGGNSQPQTIRSQQLPQQQQYMGNLAQLDRMMQMQAQNDAFGKVNWDAQASMKPQGEF